MPQLGRNWATSKRFFFFFRFGFFAATSAGEGAAAEKVLMRWLKELLKRAIDGDMYAFLAAPTVAITLEKEKQSSFFRFFTHKGMDGVATHPIRLPL